MKYLFIIALISLLINNLSCTFQSDIFRQLNQNKKGQNLIISPLSIYQVLSLLANGANGETQSEMLKTLGSNNIDELNEINYKILKKAEGFSTIDIANAVMTKFRPMEDFCSIADKYLAPIQPLVSVDQVNNWCSEKTHGKINKIIEELSPETVMLLLNAVYFKGKWIKYFEKESNLKLPFFNFKKNENKKLIETMIQTDYFNYKENSDMQIIELPFLEDFMSAIIILPSVTQDINKFIDTLFQKKSDFDKIINKLDYAKVHLELPKFEIEFSEILNDVIKELGMKKLFDYMQADLSGLDKNKNIYVSKIIHKTYLKVNEVGTEAAAVTAVVLNEMTLFDEREKIYKMKINRPFIFLIKNNRFPLGYDLVFMAKIENIEK